MINGQAGFHLQWLFKYLPSSHRTSSFKRKELLPRFGSSLILILCLNSSTKRSSPSSLSFLTTPNNTKRISPGFTPLALASSKGFAEMVQFLIEQGVNLEALDDKHQTPLMLATKAGQSSAIEILLEAGADIHAFDRKGKVSIHFAAFNGDIRSLRLLIKHGARVSEPDFRGNTPLAHGCADGWSSVVSLLVAEGATLPDGSHPDRLGTCPLETAAMAGHGDIVEALIEAYPDHIGVRLGNALLSAPQQGQTDIAILLLAHGADIGFEVGHETALRVAVNMGHEDTVRMLFEEGAQVT